MPNHQEIDPVSEDLARLRAMAADRGNDYTLRERAAEAARKLEFQMRVNAWLARRAKCNRLDEFWAGFSDEDIALLIADAVGNKDGFSLMWHAARDAVEAWANERQLAVDLVKLNIAFAWLVVLLQASVAEELNRREGTHANEKAARVKKVIVEEARRGEILKSLASEVAGNFAVPQTTKGNRLIFDDREEARSVVAEHIWEQISDYTAKSPPAASPEFLRTVMAGGLGKVLDRAREHLRTIIETQLRRVRFLEEGDAPADTTKMDGDSRVGRIAANEGISREDRILAEEILDSIGEEDGKLLVEYFVCGATQTELAAEFEISQPQVSDRLNSLLTQIRAKVASRGSYGS